MSKELDEIFRNMYGITPETPASKNLANRILNTRRSMTPPSPPPKSNSLADLLFLGLNHPASAPAAAKNSLLELMKSFDYVAPAPTPGYDFSLSGYPPVVIPPAPLPAPPPKPSSASSGASLLLCGMIVDSILKRKVDVIPGRVLPGIDDLAIMEGRRIRAAFVYSDLHGFTNLVETQPTNKSFRFLHAFVDIASRLTKHYGGQVMDCAGDRVLSVFHRPPGNTSNEPVEDAIAFAIWLQTVFKKKIGPAFAREGAGELSLGIGVDYGGATVGCIGMRGNKRIVFVGPAANNAAKLQEDAGVGEIIISAAADSRRPAYLGNGTWNLRREMLNGEIVLRINHWVDGEHPPRAR